MPSKAEEEILARQRALADKLSGISVAQASPSNNSLGKDKSSQPKQQRLLAQTNRRKRLDSILSSNKPTFIRASTKRPSLKNKTSIKNAPTNASDVLSAARQRLGIPDTSHKDNKINVKSSTLDKTSLKRLNNKRHGLASILSQSKRDSAKLLNEKVDNYPELQPDDYWRNLRSWDFLADYNDNSISNKNPNRASRKKNDRNSKSEVGSKRGYSEHENDNDKNQQDSDSKFNIPPPPSIQKKYKTIPDTFSSCGQYQHLWSPLCLAENRAQLLSEYMSYKKGTVLVSVDPWKGKNKEVSNLTDHMTLLVQCKTDHRGKSMSFMANDVCVLFTDQECLNFASEGKLNQYKESRQNHDSDDSRYCIVGHSEFFRKSCDGLLLKVSRNLYWKHIAASNKKIYLMKLGCNITGLREFTALCRIGTTPLLRYLLGKKSELYNDHPKKESKSTVSSISSLKNKGKGLRNQSSVIEEAIQSMGGSKGLGKGFITYAKKKFNPSQLGAIAAAAKEYGDGGFTLVKGPPGTGKTTTLVALLNSLHIRQFNKYYEEVRAVASSKNPGTNKNALIQATKSKPRLLVCAPSNAAVDNIILKIMESGFIDGNGCRYNPSMVRVGVGQSTTVKDVALEAKVEHLLEDMKDIVKLENAVLGYKSELGRIQHDIFCLRRRLDFISNASKWPLAREWEIRINEKANIDGNFSGNGEPPVFFVNHKDKRTCFECPPPPEPDEQFYPATSMPEYRSYVSKVVKCVERYNSVTARLERCSIVQQGNREGQTSARQALESHILDATHIVLTTLGTAGNRSLENANKFEVVVIDEAAQSVEPATLSALLLGSSHAILVGDPQQLPATIFSVSGKTTKYDRSLFQRLEESGHQVHLLDTQYRMHPSISIFPRQIFYEGLLRDGPNVKHPEFGNPLRRILYSKFQAFHPLTVFDLDSAEERGGTSLSNSSEARLALHLYSSISLAAASVANQVSRVAIITPYSQQASLLRRIFSRELGPDYEKKVEVNTVDAYQGREANIVIFSCVRAAGSHGIGFLSDVRRMNVGLTRAKYFLFIIARCRSIVVSPYWRDLVNHARETNAVVCVPMIGRNSQYFPDLSTLTPLPPIEKKIPESKKRKVVEEIEDGEI